jgi:threonylcarbamoyladenosine tRNA methylthiotransferase MtaB
LPKDQWSRLWNLIERLDSLEGDFRVRLSSLEAAEVREDFLKALKQSKRVVPHLHLCLQAGSDRVLTAMRRRYRRDSFLDNCQRVREVLDEPALTTDVIYGFPGENEADFEETIDVCRKAGFCKIHLFAYSPREGTDAAKMKETVDPKTKADRRRRLLEVEADLTREFQDRMVGRVLDVLVEQPMEDRLGWVRGTSCRHLQVGFPGIYEALRKKRFPIRVTGIEGGQLVGEPIPGAESAALENPFKRSLQAGKNGRISLDTVPFF